MQCRCWARSQLIHVLYLAPSLTGRQLEQMSTSLDVDKKQVEPVRFWWARKRSTLLSKNWGTCKGTFPSLLRQNSPVPTITWPWPVNTNTTFSAEAPWSSSDVNRVLWQRGSVRTWAVKEGGPWTKGRKQGAKQRAVSCKWWEGCVPDITCGTWRVWVCGTWLVSPCRWYTEEQYDFHWATTHTPLPRNFTSALHTHTKHLMLLVILTYTYKASNAFSDLSPSVCLSHTHTNKKNQNQRELLHGRLKHLVVSPSCSLSHTHTLPHTHKALNDINTPTHTGTQVHTTYVFSALCVRQQTPASAKPKHNNHKNQPNQQQRKTESRNSNNEDTTMH